MTIFNAYLNGQTELLEKLIGCMIGFVHVPPPGGPKLTFSIGGSDNQIIQPQLSGEIPATQESVAIIFNQLGKIWDTTLAMQDGQETQNAPLNWSSSSSFFFFC